MNLLLTVIEIVAVIAFCWFTAILFAIGALNIIDILWERWINK